MAATVVLSPHPDDAVLSVWHVLDGPGEVAVANVFTDAPPGVGPAFWDRVTGATDPAARARERAVEDRAALALAGRDPTSLGFVDYQYRDVEQPIEAVVDAVASATAEGDLVLAPAGLGFHPDHSLARDAACALRARGRRLALYADVPHAARDGWPRWVVDGGSPDGDGEWDLRLDGPGVSLLKLRAEVHRLDERAVARKREALGRYRTQLAALEEMFPVLRGPDLLRYEVVWPLPAAGGAVG